MIFIDVYGESAHFKSHFQNSSNISYSYFPRTAAIGFLAAILRYEHDSYHEDFEYKDGFAPQNLRKLVSIDKTEAIYSTSDFKFDISKLVEKIKKNIKNIECVSYFIADDLDVKINIEDEIKVKKLELKSSGNEQ